MAIQQSVNQILTTAAGAALGVKKLGLEQKQVQAAEIANLQKQIDIEEALHTAEDKEEVAKSMAEDAAKDVDAIEATQPNPMTPSKGGFGRAAKAGTEEEWQQWFEDFGEMAEQAQEAQKSYEQEAQFRTKQRERVAQLRTMLGGKK